MPDPGGARYACLWVPRFATVALVRRDPALRGRPLVAVIRTGAARAVWEVTAEAEARGVRPGMDLGEAGTRAPDLVERERDREAERSAAGALLDLGLATSPRVEVVGPDELHLDLAGVGALWGDPEERDGPEAGGRRRCDQTNGSRLGERLLLGAASLELPARVGIARTRTTAALAARMAPGVSIVPPGTEPAVLAPAPLALLAPPADLAASLDRWGIRTLGELAALPPAGLARRLGRPGVLLQRRARGEDDRPFVPYVSEEPCVEALTLDWEVTSLDALAFVLRRLLEHLAARLRLRSQGAAALRLALGLADGGTHRHRCELIAPLAVPRTWLRLLLAGLERLALPAPVVALSVEAEPAPLAAFQADLFTPPAPSPRELGETLGRLAALVGPDRVGVPTLGDTHRPTAVGVTPFSGPPARSIARRAAAAALILTDAATLVCRRLSPPVPAAVELRNGAPARIGAASVRGPVVACAGPWRTAGEWWADTAWAREEWDVALPDGAVYRLVLDQATGAWSLDAVYD
jgi:protein ImuB